MKEFVEKLIGRLEECEERYDDVSFAQLSEFGITLDYKYAEGKRDGVAETIKIVNELAEEYKPKTQADKIRSMSDEELAELFTKLAWNSEVQTTPLKYLDWLQSEVE